MARFASRLTSLRANTALQLALATGMLLGCLATSSPAETILSRGNSIVQIDPSSSLGMDKWAINGQNYLTKDWYWFRLGSGTGQKSIDQLATPSVSTFDMNHDGQADSAVVDYLGSSTGLDVSVTYTLLGGKVGKTNSQLNQQVSLVNNGTTPLDLHFFQYADLDLSPLGDSVSFPSATHVTQSAGNKFAEAVVTGSPLPLHHEAGLFSTTLTKIQSATSPATLSDANGAVSGNGTWAFEWDVTLAPGDSYFVGREMTLTVPEPSMFVLLAAAVPGLLFFFRRSRSTRP